MSMQGGNLGTATFYITGNVSGGTNAVNQMNNSLATLEQAATQNWWGLRNLGMAFAALPALVGAGTAAAIKSAIDWQDAMAGVARTNYDSEKTFKQNQDAIKNLGNELQALATRIPTGALDIASIAEAAGALGVAQDDVAAFTETVANFAAVTDVSTADASTSLARLAGLTGVAGAAYDNLASSVAITGVETAATESDILALSTRIAGVAGIVGLTADQVVALAAATRSAGVQSEAGGTAIQKTFLDINEAVRTSGDDIETWAQLAGMSVADFRATFERDAAAAFTAVISNMGALDASGANVIKMLDDVGISEQRQIRTLLSLSQAQNQNVNENLKLSNILGISAESFRNTERYGQQLEERYDTVAQQLGILKNIVFVAASSFGEAFLPAVRLVVDVLGYLVQGFVAAPGPLRAVFLVLLGLVTVFSAVAAAAFLVGPRILLISNTLRQLQGSALGAAGGMANLQRVTVTNSIATARAVLSTRALNQQLSAQERLALRAAVQTGNAARANSVLAGSTIAVGGNAAASAGGLATMIGWLGKLAKVAGVVMGILLVLASVMAIFGKKSADAAKEQLKAQGPVKKLANILADQKKVAAGAGDQWIKNQAAYKQAAKAAGELGIKEGRLLDIVKGTVRKSDFNDTIKDLTQAQKNGNKEAEQAIKNLQLLNSQYSSSKQEADALSTAADRAGTSIGELGENEEEAGKKARQAAKDQNALHDALEGIAQAHQDYIQAVFAQVSANFALADAEEALKDAREALADQSFEVAQAEQNLIEARFAEIEAVEKLHDAEEDLATARERQETAVLKAVDDLADANDQYLDGLEKIADLEEEIEKLRAGPTMQELLKATNDLRRAQLNLANSTQAVQDAEWQLNYLREEGASARDISDAEGVLADARLDHSEAQESLLDAEKELSELRDEEARREKLLDLERDLADARRNNVLVARQITQYERDLAEARRDQENNRLVAEAEAALAKARGDVSRASQGIVEAERELEDARDNTDLIRDVERAEHDLQRALYDVATANVEVRKQTALMNGETWDAGDAAHALSEELGKVIANVPDEKITGQLRDFMKVLSEAPDVPPLAEALTGDSDELASGIQGGLDGLEGMEFQLPDMTLEWPDNLSADLGISLGDLIWKALSGIAGLIIGKGIGKLITMAIGRSIGGAAGGAIGSFAGPLGTIAGIIIGLLIGYLIEKIGPKLVEVGWEIIQGLWHGIVDAWHGILDGISQWIEQNLIQPWRDALGISSPSSVFMEIGKDIIRGLWQGITNLVGWFIQNVLNFIKDLLGRFADSPTWLVDRGRELIEGLWKGIQNAKDWFLGQVGTIKNWVFDKLSDAGSWLLDRGQQALEGLWNGVLRTKDWLGTQIGNIVGWFIGWLTGKDGIANTMFGFGEKFVRGLWDGIVSLKDWIYDKVTGFFGGLYESGKKGLGDLWPFSPSVRGVLIGEGLTAGIKKGIQSTLPVVAASARSINDEVTKQLEMDMRKFSPFELSDFAARPNIGALAGGSASAVTGGSVTNIYHDEFNLEAHTDADPEDIVNSYMWAKRVRTRR